MPTWRVLKEVSGFKTSLSVMGIKKITTMVETSFTIKTTEIGFHYVSSALYSETEHGEAPVQLVTVLSLFIDITLLSSDFIEMHHAGQGSKEIRDLISC